MFYGNQYEFTSLVRELDAPGELIQTKTYPYEFAAVEKHYDSYNGINCRLRCPLRPSTPKNADMHEEAGLVCCIAMHLPCAHSKAVILKITAQHVRRWLVQGPFPTGIFCA